VYLAVGVTALIYDPLSAKLPSAMTIMRCGQG